MATYSNSRSTIILPTVTVTGTVGTPLIDDTATIAAGATISGIPTVAGGFGPGIVSIAPAATVTNSGTVTGTGILTDAVNQALNGALAVAGQAAGITNLPPVEVGGSIELLQGGSVTNVSPTSLVSGDLIGVLITGGTGTQQVVNQGTITATAGAGVFLPTGGQVSNVGTKAVITGAQFGAVLGAATTGTNQVGNQGSIIGTGANGVGLYLSDGGFVTNSSGDASTNTALIQGTLDGLESTGPISLTNQGSIIGKSGSGAVLAGVGNIVVANATGATIAGATNGLLQSSVGAVTNFGTITATATNGTGVNLAAGGSVDDFGTINAGAGGIAVNFGAGNSILTLEKGAVVNGLVKAAGTNNTLVINDTGKRTLVDIGTTYSGFGKTTLGTGANVEVTGNVATDDAISLGDGATLILDGSATKGTSVDLSGKGDVLDIANPTTYAGTIVNLGVDDTVDLLKLSPGSVVSLANGALTLKDGTTSAVSTLATNLPTTGLGLTLDASGTGVTVKAGTAVASITIPGGTPPVTTPPATTSPVTVTTGTGGTTVTTPVGTVTVPVGVSTGSGGTTVTTPVGTVSVPVGVSTGTGGTTVTTPLGNVTIPVGVTTGAGGTTISTPVGTITLPVGTGTGAGGTTITSPAGTVTVPVGGTITLPGAAGGGSTISALAGGSSSLTTTSPTGAQSTQTIASGSTIAAGTGLAAGDVITIDPFASFRGHGDFLIGGHVAAGSGVKSVTLTAIIDDAPNTTAQGTATVLGTATVASNGSYTFVDHVGAHLQGFITATETDTLGGTTSVQSPYSLEAGLKNGSYVAEQDLYTADGSDYVATTQYKRDGSRKVDVNLGGQTFQSDFFDTFQNGGAPDNTFVFDPGHGLDLIKQFRVDGTDHDTLSFKGSDFGTDAASQLAAVLANTTYQKGGAVITDPTSGDTVKLVGITKAELKANTADFAFHA